MGEVWTQWESRTVNGVYPLRRYLSASDHSSVFLTESSTEGFLNAAIKLVVADPALVDVQLWHWKTAATFSHPHLMRLLDSGQCEIDGHRLLFVVMEYAEETLSQVLPYRALGADEVRELLVPTLDALALLHSENWIQGQLKPSNFLVVNDQLKLAIDTIRPVGVAQEKVTPPTVYDPPETEHGEISVAADMWGLGVTLVEALTQYPPRWPRGRSEPPTYPDNLPRAFADIVQRCLSLNPADRPTVAELQRITRPASTAQAAAAMVPAPRDAVTPSSAANSPRATTSARAASSPPSAASTSPRAASSPPSAASTSPRAASSPPSAASPSTRAGGAPPPPAASTQSYAGASPSAAGSAGAGVPAPPGVMRASEPLSRPSAYADSQESEQRRRGVAGPLIAAIVVIALAVWGGSRFFRSHSESPQQSGAAPSSTTDSPTASGQEAQSTPQSATSAATSPAPPATSSPPPLPSPPTPAPSASAPPPGSRSAPSPASRASARSAPPEQQSAVSTGNSAAVVHEEIPKASESARQTIHGHVKVIVRVAVDRSGKVVRDTFDDPSSSKYFNRLASEAARKWRFASSDNEGVREWLLRFEFGREGTTVHATRSRS